MSSPSSRPSRAVPVAEPSWRQPGLGGLRPARVVAGVLLLIAIVLPLLVPTYARRDPELWGFPFFYWYQLLWVFIAAILVGSAFVLVRRDEQAHRAELTHGRVLGQDDPFDEELGRGSGAGEKR